VFAEQVSKREFEKILLLMVMHKIVKSRRGLWVLCQAGDQCSTVTDANGYFCLSEYEV